MPFGSLSMFSRIFRRKATESISISSQGQGDGSKQRQGSVYRVAIAQPSKNEKGAKRAPENDASCPPKIARFELQTIFDK